MNASKSFLAAVTLLTGTIAYAQQPVPAQPQGKGILISGGTLHTGTGAVMQNTQIVLQNGKITYVGTSYPGDKSSFQLIEARGKHIYPGFIALNTNLGLSEIEAVRSTRDFAETGDVNPNSRSLIAYNTDSKVTPTVRSNGVLLAQVAPKGGLVSGSSSIVQLDAWNWEDAAYKADEGVHINWPRMTVFNAWWAAPADKQKEQIQQNLRALEKEFADAKAYSQNGNNELNLKLESMKGLFNAKKKLYIHVDGIKEITAALQFCRKLGITPVLVGASDAWRLTGLIRESNAAVILGEPHSLPDREDDDIDQPYKNAATLVKAGIKTAISIDGFWQVRNLGFQAGTAATYGLTSEQALQLITSNAAEICGIGKSTGTIENGKDATLFISDGDALDMRSNVQAAFIQGRSIDLRNVQTELYKRYMKKYRLAD